MSINRKEEKNIVYTTLPSIYTKNYIAQGVYGSCYKVDDNTAFKLFHDYNYYLDIYDNVKKLSTFDSDFFVFPEAFIYQYEISPETILGYTMQYIDGNKLNDLDKKVDIRRLFSLFDSLEKEIKEYTTEEGLLFEDIHDDNILFSKDGKLKVLDVDLYKFSIYEEPIMIYKSNMKELGNCILPIFFKKIRLKDEKLQRYYLSCILDGKVKPSYILFEALNSMEKEMGSVNTLGEFDKGLKLIRK